jgi:hypothetical protein
MVGVTIESLTDLTFVDGYIYVRGDTGVLVWIGDLSRGYFKTVIENKPGQQFDKIAASAARLSWELLAFGEENGSFFTYALHMAPAFQKAIAAVDISEIEDRSKAVISNDNNMAFVQTRTTLRQFVAKD